MSDAFTASGLSSHTPASMCRRTSPANSARITGISPSGGNRYLRKTGYEVMQSYVMHKPANDPIFTFIEKKRSEGKSGKLAMVAGLNKFLRVYYGKVTELYRSLPAIE